jgi:hypothetical protein
MTADFEKRVRSIKWSEYSHPCIQDQSLIPGLLLEIVRGSDDVKRKAAERLWDVAAHQGNVGPSAVPATRFLIEIFEEMPIPVQIETLDTLYQFSNYFRGEPWSTELRGSFLDALPLFRRLSTSACDDVSDFSKMIIEKIEANE